MTRNHTRDAAPSTLMAFGATLLGLALAVSSCETADATQPKRSTTLNQPWRITPETINGGQYTRTKTAIEWKPKALVAFDFRMADHAANAVIFTAPGGAQARINRAGELYVTQADGTRTFSTGTANKGATMLTLTDKGEVKIDTFKGTTLWKRGGAPQTGPNKLAFVQTNGIWGLELSTKGAVTWRSNPAAANLTQPKNKTS